MAPRKEINTAAQLPVGTRLHMLGSAHSTSFKITAATSSNPSIPRTSNDVAAGNKIPLSLSTTLDNLLPPPPSVKKASKPNLLKIVLMNSTFKDLNGKTLTMDNVAWPSPPSFTLGKRTRDENEIERAEKRQNALAGNKIDPVAAASLAAMMRPRVITASKVKTTVAPSGRAIEPSPSEDGAGGHYNTLRIKSFKVRGKDRVSVDYFSRAYNRGFLDILRRINECGTRKLIAVAVDMLFKRLVEIETKEAKFFDYHTFETQYQEPLQKLQTGSGSAHNVKRTVKNADDAQAIIDSCLASEHGKPKELVKAKLVDYRLVWPACVFKMA